MASSKKRSKDKIHALIKDPRAFTLKVKSLPGWAQDIIGMLVENSKRLEADKDELINKLKQRRIQDGN